DDYQHQIQENFADAQDGARACYPATRHEDVRTQVACMFADTQFNYGTRLLARAMAARDMPTWRSLFTRRRPDQEDGPHHGDEVAYAFGNLASTAQALGLRFDATDTTLSHAMMHAWTQFALTSVPLLPDATAWPAYETER